MDSGQLHSGEKDFRGSERFPCMMQVSISVPRRDRCGACMN